MNVTSVMNISKTEDCTKDELLEKIKSLKAHNKQLQNIIAKSNKTNSKNNLKRQKSFNFDKVHFRHILLKFFYLGWDYQGFATQEDTTKTIEFYLFEALTKTCLIKNRETSNYHRCGRTDKGVSAFNQVISIDIRSKFPPEQQDSQIENELEYCKILNRVLPKDIQCIGWCSVTSDFSARFDCKSRTYKYLFPSGELDILAMEKGLSYLVGTHDFRNLCKMDVANGVVTFVRTILEARLEVAEGESVEQGQGYRMMAVVLRGSGFLWHQVRCVVGVLLLVGRGLEQPEVLRDLLDTERHPARPGYLMASEQPLCLFECEYELETIWRCDRGARDALVRGLQRQWVELGTRAALVRAMLHRLECDEEQPQPQPQLSAALTPGQAARSHTPLHLRQTCATLQDRIRHFTAKGRIACTPAPPAAHSECSNIKQ